MIEKTIHELCFLFLRSFEFKILIQKKKKKSTEKTLQKY